MAIMCFKLFLLTQNGFFSVLLLNTNEGIELLSAGHRNNSELLTSADDGISKYDSLSKHLFCSHCAALPSTVSPRSVELSQSE